MSKAIRRIALLAAVMTFSTGCSLFQGLIPDVELSNPLALDGAPVAISGFAPAASALEPQQATYTGTGTLPETPVGEIAAAELPAGIAPVALTTDIGLQSRVVMSSTGATDDADFPDRLTFTVAAVETFRISDESASSPVELGPIRTPADATVELEKNGPCTVGFLAVTCDYDIVSGADDFVIEAEIRGDELRDFLDILSNDVTPNVVSGSFSLTLQGDIPGGLIVNVTLSAPTGVLSF